MLASVTTAIGNAPASASSSTAEWTPSARRSPPKIEAKQPAATAAQILLDDRLGVVAAVTQIGGELCGQVLVELEVHVVSVGSPAPRARVPRQKRVPRIRARSGVWDVAAGNEALGPCVGHRGT